MKASRFKWLVVFGFILVVFLFLGNALQSDITLQGPDNSYGMIHHRHLVLQKADAFWNNQIWLGDGLGKVPPRLYFFLLKVAPDTQAVPLTYLITMILGMILLFAFLSELGLSFFPAVFGAISWGFTPHLISLMNGGHIGLAELLIWAPAVLLFMALGMRRKHPAWVQWMSLVISGVSWASLMMADPQRGFYLSVVAAVWFVYLLLSENNISLSLKSWKSVFQKKVVLHGLRVFVIGGVLLLAFAPNLKWWLGSDLMKGQQVGVTQQNDEAKWKFASSYSQDPLELLDNLAFGYFGTITGSSKHPYWGRRAKIGEFRGNATAIGFFTMMLMILGTAVYFRKRSEVAVFAVILGGAWLLSFGHFLPGKPFFWIFYKLPFMSKFRVPEKFTVVVSLLAVILAAYGLESLRELALSKAEEKKKQFKTLFIATLVLSGIALVWFLLLKLMQNDMAYDLGKLLKNSSAGKLAASNAGWAVLRFLGFSAVLNLVTALLWKAPDGKKMVWVTFPILILFGIVDLWTINAPYKKQATVQVSKTYQEDGVLTYLNKTPLGTRVATSLKIPYRGEMRPYPTIGLRGYYLTYLFPYYNIESLDVTAVSRINPEYRNYFLKILEGSNKGQVKTWNDLYAMNERLLQLSAVRYLLADAKIENINLELVEVARGLDGREHSIYEVKGSLPRLSFYANYLVETNRNKELSLIADPLVDFQSLVVVENPGLKTRLDFSMTRMDVPVLDARPGWIKTRLTVPTDGVLLHVARYNANWKAKIDGHEAPVFRANYLQQGVVIPAGTHEVELAYDPPSSGMTLTLILVLLGVGLTVFLALFYVVREMKGKDSQDN